MLQRPIIPIYLLPRHIKGHTGQVMSHVLQVSSHSGVPTKTTYNFETYEVILNILSLLNNVNYSKYVIDEIYVVIDMSKIY